MMQMQSQTRRGRRRLRGWIPWIVLVVIMLIPLRRDGVWLPLIFVIFEWMNNFLPENF